ncbi:MAG TPA: hypothetical protein PLO50_07775 [Nitrospira sp.]|nr:hypothetical protein [Nitrospira sp.]
MPSFSIAEILELSAKAEQYGPYLFVVLLGVVAFYVLSKFASDLSIKDKRAIFWVIMSVVIIAILVLGRVAISDWLRGRVAIYTYTGVIKCVKNQDKLFSNKVYFRPEFYPLDKEKDPDFQARDEYFLVIKDHPFKENDHFNINYSKGLSNLGSRVLSLDYRSVPEREWRIDYDEAKDNYSLVDITDHREQPCKEKSDQSGSLLLGSAFAFSSDDFTHALRKVVMPTSLQNDNTVESSFDVLRQERQDVARKLAAIEQLNAAVPLREFLERNPLDTLVLLDLTRHTDRELAYKVRKLTEQVGINAVLVTALNPPEKLKAWEDLLFRIEPARAEKILEEISTHKDVDSKELFRLRKEVQSGRKARVLIPTASATGDRYYVKAEWTRENQEVVKCLTDVFKGNVPSTRTWTEEKQYMSNRSVRYAYDYSKSWALGMADNIEKCGGKATFVGL